MDLNEVDKHSLVIMANIPMKCQVQDCVHSHTTAANLSTFNHQYWDLEFHLRMAHPMITGQTAFFHPCPCLCFRR